MPHGTTSGPSMTHRLLLGTLLLVLGCGETLLPLEGQCLLLIAPFADSLYTGAVDSLETATPSRVRLSDRRIRDQGGHAAWAIDSIPGATPSVHTMRYWMTPSPDSVVLVFSTGFAGVALRLDRGGETLSGQAESFFDYRGGDLTSATAKPVQCDAPVPPSERYTSHIIGEVRLRDHDHPLRLDEPLDTPSISIDSVVNTLVHLRAAPIGMLQGGSGVIVGTRSGGVVRSIDVAFPDSVAVQDVVKQLEAELGPPTAEHLWVDRMFMIHVQESESRSRGVSVSISRSRGH